MTVVSRACSVDPVCSFAHGRFLKKFREEATFLSRLSQHPSIVRVFDLNVTTSPRVQEVPYLVLEWLEGAELERSMADRKQRGLPPLGEREAIAMLRPVIDAIGLAHSLRIARDRFPDARALLAALDRVATGSNATTGPQAPLPSTASSTGHASGAVPAVGFTAPGAPLQTGAASTPALAAAFATGPTIQAVPVQAITAARRVVARCLVSRPRDRHRRARRSRSRSPRTAPRGRARRVAPPGSRGTQSRSSGRR